MTEKNHKILLICHISSEIGIGHLSRLLALASELDMNNNIVIDFLIFGSSVKSQSLVKHNVYNFPVNADMTKSIEKTISRNKYRAIVFDIYPQKIVYDIQNYLESLRAKNIILVSIDSLFEYCNCLNLIWIPALCFNEKKYINCKCKFSWGWDSFLLKKKHNHNRWQPGSKTLILTGGSDPTNLGGIIPEILDSTLAHNTELHWVRGPFSSQPKLPKVSRLGWTIHDAPNEIDDLLVTCNYVMTVFGVSLFEALQYGVPTVVFPAYGQKDHKSLSILSKDEVALTAYDYNDGIIKLSKLMENKKLAQKYSQNALSKLSSNGSKSLSHEILSLMGIT